MAVINYTAITDTFIVVYDNVSFYRCIFAPATSHTTTGQPFMQEFSSFAAAQVVFNGNITDPTPILT